MFEKSVEIDMGKHLTKGGIKSFAAAKTHAEQILLELLGDIVNSNN